MKIHLQDKYFEAIKEGTKTIEGRLAKQKYRDLHVGDTVTFHNDLGEETVKRIKAIHIYRTFEEAFSEVDFRDALPGVDNIRESVLIYSKFYTLPEQEEYNILFISI